MKLLLKIAYNGAGFSGWQVQKKSDARTVQGVLTEAARTAFSADCAITGCSRTDSGVHAREFYCTVEGEGLSCPPDRVPHALNTYLPDDISVYSAIPVSDDFHPRYMAKGKEYVYLIDTREIRDPFLGGRMLHYPVKIKDEDIKRLNDACGYFVGEHDFTAFMAKGSKITDAVRRIEYCRAEYKDGILSFTVAANGFLYNQVRITVGTLLSVLRNKISPEDIKDIITSKDRGRAGITVPPDGLYLNKVFY